MQIKNKPMEFTSKQSNQLKQLKDMVKLNSLQVECVEFKQELETLITERSEGLTKREILMERLNSLRQEITSARNKELKWREKLETANKTFVENNNDNLQSICSLLGYQISKCEVLENHGLQITLHYRDICYVTYSETGQMFDLIEVFPEHCDFPKIQQFLQNSQDLRSVLTLLRKFFDFALELKEKQEKN